MNNLLSTYLVDEWHKACVQKHESAGLLRLLEECFKHIGMSRDEIMSCGPFVDALLDRSAAEIRLDELSCANKRDLLQMMKEKIEK